jgi:hypothetical protein
VTDHGSSAGRRPARFAKPCAAAVAVVSTIMTRPAAILLRFFPFPKKRRRPRRSSRPRGRRAFLSPVTESKPYFSRFSIAS